MRAAFGAKVLAGFGFRRNTDGSTVLLEEKFYAGSTVGPRTRLLTSDDGGVTWSQRPSACRNGAQGTNVPVIGADNAMYLFCEFSAATKLMVSNDGGESFSDVGNVPGALHDAAGYDQTLTKGGGVGDAVGCQIERSDDGGDTWKPTAIADHQMTSLVVDNLQFTDARHGTLACVLSEGRPTEGIDVYRTTDGGGTWRPLGLNTAVRTG